MSDLISRCELFNRLATVQTLGEAYGIIQEMPTVDAVEVVRCKDCKFSDWYTAVNGGQYCYCSEHGTSGHQENDFCSYGEKDGDQ